MTIVFRIPGPLGPPAAVVESYASNATVTATLGAFTSGQVGIAFRVATLANYWRFTRVNSVLYRLEKIVASATTVAGEFSGKAPAVGDVLSVTLAGSSIVCKVNGASVITATDAHSQSATKHGFYNSGPSSNLIRDVAVTA